MSYRSAYNSAPKQPAYMNASGADVFLGFGGLALMALGVSLLVSGYPTVMVLLSSLANAPWSELGTAIAANVACGAAGGLAIGWLRVHRPARRQAVDELVGAAASPDLASAARINATAVALHIGSGICAGLLVGVLGTAAPSEWGDHVLTLGGPLRLALGGPGGGGGEWPADGWALLSSLFAFMLVVGALTILASIVLHGLLATAAQSAVTGAAQGWGQALGTSFVLAATRLWTSRVSWQGIAAREAPPLSLDAAIQEYAGADEHTRRLIGRYLDWLRETGYPVTIESAAARFYDWGRFLESRGKGRPPQVVALFHLHLDDEIRKRNPAERFVEPPGVPQFDGRQATLLYRGWFRRALRTGAIAGAASGFLQAGIVSLFVAWLKR
jgi:hypothetical protein